MSALELVAATARREGRTVLDGVSLSVASGEMVALVGPNGAGKSSAIRALAGLLALESGQARLGGVDVASLSATQRAERTAWLAQERRIAWNLPAIEVAALGLPFLSGTDAAASARAALDEVEAGHLADRGVADMSGGERARVLLARALAAPTRALLADEPVAGLDPDAQLMVLDRLKERTRLGQAVLVSLHDLQMAARFADRVVVLDQGRVVADDTPILALKPSILAEVFGLSARWIEGPDGPLLAATRFNLPVRDGTPAGRGSKG